MKKIKLPPPEFSTTYKPPAVYVVRLEQNNNCLIARYFQVTDQEPGSDATALDAMKPISLDPPILMRKVETKKILVPASAVTSNADLQNKILQDIGYQVFAPGVGSSSVCGFGERQDFSLFCLPFTHQGKVGEPFNHFTEGESVKGMVTRIGRLRDAQPIFMLYSDVAGAPLNEWTLYYIHAQPFVFEDATDGAWINQEETFDYTSLLPSFEVSTPSSIDADGFATVTVSLKREGQMVAYNGEIQAEQISGYLPKRRASVANGVASFKVMALGLQAGESVRIKVGTKNITGLADVSIPVV